MSAPHPTETDIRQQLLDLCEKHHISEGLNLSGTLFEDDLLALISQTVSSTEKAYGGCHKCYGKGYRTTIEGTEYMGNDLQYHKMPVRQVMHYCTCDRGKQLERLLGRETSE